jgi:glycosyltransferase involved in cell wall biosynthesis
MTDPRHDFVTPKEYPQVTVLMPAYNAAPFLRAALDSILAQTFTDFELIVVDDASTDSTPAILSSYSDPRLRVVRLDRNSGVSAARNKGISLTKGSYLALMDADDISHPERLAKQIAYLDQHPQVAGVGCLIDFIDECGLLLYQESLHKPLLPDDVSSTLPNGCCFTPSSMVFRFPAIQETGGYNGSDVAEDYDLILRVWESHDLANIKEWLYAYRVHSSQASFTKIKKMRRMTDFTKLQSYQRRLTHGRIPPGATPPLPDLLSRLRGKRYTLAADYLSWAGSYFVLQRYRQSLGLALRALLHAPLCPECYKQIGRAAANIILPHRYRSILSWYVRKIFRRTA